MKYVFMAFVRLYRMTISRLLPPNTCRFFPTCSQYALDALEKYGAVHGAWMSIRRILRCHPWNPGGYDPVQ